MELYKAYGYLDDKDLERKIVCFDNSELLEDKAIASIQEIINLLTRKRIQE